MKTVARVGLAGLLAASLLGGTPALANEDDVIARGGCSMGSTWKIKNSPENNGSLVEIEFEVDQNVVGDTWMVRLFYNGQRIFRGQRTTQAPSGSFEVERVVNNQAGPDTSRGVAENLRTGEICRGRVTSDF